MAEILLSVKEENDQRWNKTDLEEAIWKSTDLLFEKLKQTNEFVDTKEKSSKPQVTGIFSYNQPTEELLQNNLRTTLLNQLRTSSKETKFSALLRKRITVVKRILIGLQSPKPSLPKKKKSTSSKKKETTRASPLIDLSVRTGIRLLLVMLRECWELDGGIDSDICREFLQNMSEILGSLPRLSLYDTQMSSLGVNTLSSIESFLKEAAVSAQVNPSDRITSLSLLGSFCAQRGGLSGVLSFISYLLSFPKERELPTGTVYSLLDQMSQQKQRVLTERLKNEITESSSLFSEFIQQIEQQAKKTLISPKNLCFLVVQQLCDIVTLYALPDDDSVSDQACEVFIWGCSANGKLGNDVPADLVKIASPTLSNAFSSLNPKQVALGSSMTTIVDDEGKVYSCGKGEYGRLGIDSTSETDQPTAVNFDGVAISTVYLSTNSYGHGIAIDENKGVWSWGDGDYGKLGHNDTEQYRTPRKISFFDDIPVIKASCGPKHSAIITEMGQLYTFGSNESGRLGFGPSVSAESSYLPKVVQSLSKYIITDVACGDAHTIATSMESHLTWSWGDGSNGRLGLGSATTHTSSPMVIEELRNVSIVQLGAGSGTSIALTCNGVVYAWGDCVEPDKQWTPTKMEGQMKGHFINQISVGRDHILALSKKSDVFAWGKNNFSQCGSSKARVHHPELLVELSGRNIKQICAGSSHSAALTRAANIRDLPAVSFAPYAVELSKKTFVQLKEFLSEHYPTSKVLAPGDETNMFLSTCLRVLRANLYHAYATQTDVTSLGLEVEGNLLSYFCHTLLEILQTSPCQILQNEAKAAFQAGWAILLPSVRARCKLLLKLLLSQEHQESFGDAQRFLVDLLVSTLTKDNEMAQIIGLRMGNTNNSDYKELENLFDVLLNICSLDGFGILERVFTTESEGTASSGSSSLLAYLQKYAIAKLLSLEDSSQHKKENAESLKAKENQKSDLLRVLQPYFTQLIQTMTEITKTGIQQRNTEGSTLTDTVFEALPVFSVFSQFLYAAFNIPDILSPHFDSLIALLLQLDELCSLLPTAQANEMQELAYKDTKDDTIVPCRILDLSRTLGMFLGYCCHRHVLGKSPTSKEKQLDYWLSNVLVSGGLAPQGYRTAHADFIKDLIEGKETPLTSELIKRMTSFARNKLWLVGKDDDDEMLLSTLRHILACLLKHHGCISVGKMFASSSAGREPPTKLISLFQGVYNARDRIIEAVQQLSDDEIPNFGKYCEPIIVRCRFLLYDISAATPGEELSDNLLGDDDDEGANTLRSSGKSDLPHPEFPRYELRTSAGDLVLPIDSPTASRAPDKEENEFIMAKTQTSIRRASSYYSGQQKIAENENLATVVSTMRRFSWLKKEHQISRKVNSLRESIIEFVLKPKNLLQLKCAMSQQQERGESRVRGLKETLLLLHSKNFIDSLRYQIVVGAFNLWIPSCTTFHYLDHIPAALNATQSQVEQSIHQLYEYLVCLMKESVEELIHHKNEESFPQYDRYRWYIHCVLQALTSPFNAADVATLVGSGMISILRNVLHPKHEDVFGKLIQPSTYLLHSLLATIGADAAQLGNHSLSQVESFLRELLVLYRDNEKSEIAELLCVLRRICVSARIIEVFSAPTWTDLLVSIVNSGTLKDRIMALRFLEVILLSWKFEKNKSRISQQLHQFFRILSTNVCLPQIRETVLAITGNFTPVFDKSYCKSVSIEDDGFSFIQTESARINTPGYAFGMVPISEGVHRWEFQVLHDAVDDETLCIGVGTKPLRETNFETSSELWVLRGYNGKLYHRSELQVDYEGFSIQDKIAIEVDMTAGTLTYYRNGRSLGVAFNDISGTVYPVVLFYGGSTRARVAISESGCQIPSKTVTELKSLVDTLAAPTHAAFCEELVYLLRRLHSTGWGRLINQFITIQCRSLPKSYAKFSAPDIHAMFVPPLDKETEQGNLFAALVLLGGVENGFRHGGRVLHSTYGIGYAIAFNIVTNSVLVHYEPTRVQIEYAKFLRALPAEPFQSSKLILSRAELHTFASIITQITPESTTLQQSQIQLFALRALDVLVSEKENLASLLQRPRNTKDNESSFLASLLDLAVAPSAIKPLLEVGDMERLVSLLYKDVSMYIASFGVQSDIKNPKRPFIVPGIPEESEEALGEREREEYLKKLGEWFVDPLFTATSPTWKASSDIIDIPDNNEDIDINKLLIKKQNDTAAKPSTETLNNNRFRELTQLLLQKGTPKDKERLLYETSRSLQVQYARLTLTKIFSRKPLGSDDLPLVDFSHENEDTRIKLACLVRIIASGRAGEFCQQKLIDMVGYLLDCDALLAQLLMEQCIDGFLRSALLPNQGNKNLLDSHGTTVLSDLESIASPSFHLSKALLPSLIKQESLSHPTNDKWKLQLANALAACVISVQLTGEQRSWASVHLASLCLRLFASDGKEGVLALTSNELSHFSKLHQKLSPLIEQQFRIESAAFSEKIFFSEYLQSLATLFYLLPHEEVTLKEMRSFCLAVSVVRSLASRKPFCDEFVKEIRLLAEKSGEDVECLGYEDNQQRWNLFMDQELSNWRTEQPNDWKRPVNVFTFGSNSYGQLNHEEDEEVINQPIMAPVITQLSPSMVCGGNQCTFVVTQDGLVYASGKGDYMRLGLGSSDNSTSLKLLRSLQAIRIEKVAASKGSYGHALAIDSQGHLWSWGDGDHGKLGHGNTEQQKHPKQISAFKRKRIKEISCGYTFSMCITEKGKLYSWGERPWNGHNISDDLSDPTCLTLEQNQLAGLVACGQSHTLVTSADGKTVWSFGDGANGKLGLGSDESHFIPHKIAALQDVGIVKVDVGSDFNMALTETGKVYSWGSGAFSTLGHGDVNDRLVPMVIYALEEYQTIDVSCGATHVIAIVQPNASTDETDVYSWGQNEQGQLGIGNSSAALTPKRIPSLSNKGIQQVCTGNHHSILWTMKKKYDKPFYPTRVPTKYGRLHHKAPAELYFRAHLLQKFSELVYEALPFFNIRSEDVLLSHGLDSLRGLLHTPGKISLLRSWVAHTNSDNDVGPTIVLNRYAARKGESLFAQAAKQLPQPDCKALRAAKRAWKVQFAGEGADDVGGPYNESVSEMCLELQSPTNPTALFKLSRNGRNREGDNQDRYVLRPASSQSALKLYRFFGVFMGVSIRTKNPLRLFIAPIFWKQLLRIPVTLEDLASVDKTFVTTFRYLMDIDQYGIVDEESFSLLPLEPFKPLKIGPNEELPLTFYNRKEYVKKAIELHLHKACEEEFKAIREGMEQMLPLSLFSLFTPEETENLVCGAPEIDWEVLKVNTMYKGSFSESSKQCKWLWEILDQMDAEDRACFLRFVWGHTRLPADPADIKQQFIVQSSNSSPPNDYLPSAQTCFFKIVLPLYSSKEVLREKLIYAIRFCKTIDTDDYARHEIAAD